MTMLPVELVRSAPPRARQWTHTPFLSVGNDTITARGGESAKSGDGSDAPNMGLVRGLADGAFGVGTHRTGTVLRSIILETGSGGNDAVCLEQAANLTDLMTERRGDDLVITSGDEYHGGINCEHNEPQTMVPI